MATTSNSENRRIDSMLPLEVVDRNPSPKVGGRRGIKWRPCLFFLIVPASIALAAAYPSADRNMEVGLSSVDMRSREPISPPLAVVALGRLEPEGQIIAVAAPSGSGESRIGRLLVGEGDTVEQNEVLAVLDNQDRLAAARQVAVDTVEQARASLARTKLEVETTSTQLQAALRAAQARLEAAKVRLTRSKQLLRQQAVSQEEFDDRELSVTTAEETVREAASRIKRYEAVSQNESVDINLAEKDLAVAESSLKQAEANLEQALVRAPIDGMVLQLKRRAGERVGQSALLEMGATNNMMARVEVYESEIQQIRPGQQATLTASPLEGPLSGKVDRIANFVKKQEIVDADPAANTDARILEVWVRLDRESSAQAAKFVNLQVRVEFQR